MPKKPTNAATAESSGNATPERKKQRYHSPLRQQQSEETRCRIVAAGSTIVHRLPAWDWKNLTARAVAEVAEVSERTVHRYFPTERKLRDAVLQRLVEESGIDLDEMTLEGFGDCAARLFHYLASFAVVPAGVGDPSMDLMDAKRRDALLAAVARATPGWTQRQRLTAAGVLDVLWNVPSYERLTAAWGLDADQAVDGITWAIDLIQTAVAKELAPGGNENS